MVVDLGSTTVDTALEIVNPVPHGNILGDAQAQFRVPAQYFSGRHLIVAANDAGWAVITAQAA